MKMTSDYNISWLFGLFILLGGLGMLIQGAAAANNGELYEKGPENLVMQGDDLDTEWQYEDIEVSEGGTIATREAFQTSTSSAYTITNTVHVFDSREKAKQAYEEKITPVKEQRGYTELTRIFGQDEFGEDSFAYRPSETQMLGYVYFYDRNVFVELELASGSEFNLEMNTLLELAESIENRLPNHSTESSNTQPEKNSPTVEELQRELEKKNQKISELENSDDSPNVEELQRELEEKNQKISELENRIEQLQNTIAELEQTIDDLRNQVTQLKNASQSKTSESTTSNTADSNTRTSQENEQPGERQGVLLSIFSLFG